MVRFKTKLRGKKAEVSMEIKSLDPIDFIVEFHRGEPKTRLTREELTRLCREAARVAGKRSTH